VNVVMFYYDTSAHAVL